MRLKFDVTNNAWSDKCRASVPMSDVPGDTPIVGKSVNKQQNIEFESRAKHFSVTMARKLAFKFLKAVDPVVKGHEAEEAGLSLDLCLRENLRVTRDLGGRGARSSVAELNEALLRLRV